MPAVIIPLIGAVVFGVWLYTAYNCFMMFTHRKLHLPLSSFIFSGSRFFKLENFESEAEPYFKGFIRGFCLFFGLILAGVIFSFVMIFTQQG